MARVIGKAFKISRKTVGNYGYAKPGKASGGRMARNGGVTAIAAINGRGAFLRNKGRSARSAMQGLSRNARLARARKITGADRSAFASRMGAARKTKGANMRTNATQDQIAAARRNIRKAIAARAGHRANPRRRRSTSHLRNIWSGEVKRHSHAAVRGWYSPSPYASTAGTAAKRRKHKANKKTKARKAGRKKKSMRTNARRHRRNFSRKQRTAALRNLRKARRARLSPNRKRPVRRKRALRKNAKRRTTRRSHRRNGLMANRKKRTTRKTHRRNKRRTTKRRTHRANAKRRTTRKTHRRNFSRKQRAAALRNLKKARMARNGRKTRRGTRKRTHRANKRRTTRRSHRRNGLMANRRRKSTRKSHRKNTHRRRKSHRRNGHSTRLRGSRKAFRKNEFMATIQEVLKVGALTTAGFVAHKAITKLFTDNIVDKLFGSHGAVTPPAAPAVSGLEMFQPYRSIIGGAAVAAAGVYLTNQVVKDARTKMFITAGMATSLVHSIAVVVLAKLAPKYAGYLSGHDGTAASMSAMYGFGGGASIMPEYHPIGEYFAQNGLGEYFAQNGLGAYTSNPDMMQAAAGYGGVENQNSNILNPGADLDRELSIAEAAAGVGALPYEAAAGFGRVQPFEASAGIGEYFAQNGLGAISSVRAADTWVPGTSDGQLWAGTRAISSGQGAHEMTSAGILETGGNQGVFG